MAIIRDSGTCRHCGEAITQRTYAAPYAADEHARTYGVRLWVSGNGAFPGDQRFCEEHVIDTDGSIGDHEPAGV